MVPYTRAEERLYYEGHLEDPKAKCELGFQSVHYVLKNNTKSGGVPSSNGKLSNR